MIDASRDTDRPETCDSPGQDTDTLPDPAASRASCNHVDSPTAIPEESLRQSVPTTTGDTVLSLSGTRPFTSEVPEPSQILMQLDLHSAHENESSSGSQAQPITYPNTITPEPGEVDHLILLNFYFTDLCRLNSAFDSSTNPFRHVIAQWAAESPLIMNCVLSMSARALFPFRTGVLALAVHHHTVAVGHLSVILDDITGTGASHPEGSHGLVRRSIHQIKQAILASIMLGISSVSFCCYVQSFRIV